MAKDTAEKFVDLDSVFKKRNPKLYRWIPRFGIRLLERLIHQDDINRILSDYGDKQGIEFIEAVFEDFGIKTQSEGIEKIPKDGHFVFAANHPLGGLDGLAIILELGKYYNGNVKAIINDLLLNIENLKPVFQGVNVYGHNTKKHIKELDDLYKSDTQIIVFPAGLVSRKIKGKIQDLKWKKSFLTKALQYKRDIVPVYIEGQNSKMFYNIANFRKGIGIKFNYELVLLPHEMFTYNYDTITMKFGEPIPYETFDKSKSLDEWTLYIRKRVYEIQEKSVKK